MFVVVYNTSMEYTTTVTGCVVLFMVEATEPVGGFRLIFTKTFELEKAIRACDELSAQFGPAGHVKILEREFDKRLWEHKFPDVPWPLQ